MVCILPVTKGLGLGRTFHNSFIFFPNLMPLQICDWHKCQNGNNVNNNNNNDNNKFLERMWKCLPQRPRALSHESWPLEYWYRGFETNSRHGRVCVFLCCAVLCGYRPCDVPISRPGGPTKCLKNIPKSIRKFFQKMPRLKVGYNA
jgi:hypothetical protein